MLFLDFGSELFDAFKSKYQEVAESYKGKNINFLIGDLDASEGAFQVYSMDSLFYFFIYTIYLLLCLLITILPWLNM